MSLKFAGEFSVMTIKNDVKFEEEFTCQFDPNTRKSQKIHFNGILLNKVYNVSAKKSIEELSLMALTIDATSEEKRTSIFKNDMRNLANFHLSIFGSLKILIWVGYFYSK